MTLQVFLIFTLKYFLNEQTALQDVLKEPLQELAETSAYIRKPLDENLVAGLIGFYAFTGFDTTGGIAGKGKQTCWKLFRNANKDILKAFARLGQTLVPSNEVV